MEILDTSVDFGQEKSFDSAQTSVAIFDAIFDSGYASVSFANR